MSDDFDCPCCGAAVQARANFCRECGASDDSGWNEDEVGFGDDEDFDYDDYLEREFAIEKPRSQAEQLRRMVTAGIILLVCISLTLLSLFGI